MANFVRARFEPYEILRDFMSFLATFSRNKCFEIKVCELQKLKILHDNLNKQDARYSRLFLTFFFIFDASVFSVRTRRGLTAKTRWKRPARLLQPLSPKTTRPPIVNPDVVVKKASYEMLLMIAFPETNVRAITMEISSTQEILRLSTVKSVFVTGNRGPARVVFVIKSASCTARVISKHLMEKSLLFMANVSTF